MGPCYTKITKKKSLKNLYNTAVVNMKPNEIENPDNKTKDPTQILTEKKEIRKNLDEKYRKIPNFFNVNNKLSPEENLYGAVGLFNLGNTCFLNAALQLLSNTQPLTDYFLSGLHIKEISENNPLGSQGAVVYQFGLLIKELWITQEPAIEPNDFYESIKKFAPRFSEGNQEDIQEFLIYLLDIIHEDLNRVYKEPTRENSEQIQLEVNEAETLKKETLNLPELELLAAKEWQGYLKKNRSIIVDLFQGQIKNSIKCLQCSTVSHKFEPIMYISVPIPQSEEEDEENYRFDIDLLDCLKEFTKEEQLDRTETFFCEKCQARVECSKKIEIWKMPNILIIHFKRFRYNKKQRKKIDTYINFPLTNLDLSSFQSVEPKEKPIYDLFAVANHEGSLNKGHYYSFAKNDEDKRWYMFDDEIVQLIKKPQKQIVSSHAYLLFYAKTSNDYFFRQTLTAPELWPHLVKIKEALMNPNNNNVVGRIRSSTGIRESVRLQTFTSVANSLENKNKSIDRFNEFDNNKREIKKNYQIKPSGVQISRSSEGTFKKSLNLINNYIENDPSFKENNHSEKEIKHKEEEFFERMDNLAEKKNKILNKRKHDRVISIIEEEKGYEGNVSLQTESEVLKGRLHVEFIYKEDDRNGVCGPLNKKLEIINN